ncbi:NACHT domain-containing protein [Dactylosporangium sp. CA-139114]|uniref:NACHT domain-containing protein n=1 Tax=Dactylosporangium sp. CA-139114 TaxID=3239931 RepID=UPI003D951B33
MMRYWIGGCRCPAAGPAPTSTALKDSMALDTINDSWKYLYERLGEKRFQQLCNALLVRELPGVQCFPVGQKDGGRDAVQHDGERRVIFQVKWSKTRIRTPVTWLDNAIKEEADNIRRLVAAGADAYYLMTCVAGTATPKRGTMDKLDERLAAHSKAFGIPMTCWWQADLDARVDLAPDELKWSYADMLAGHDLVRYMIEGDRRRSRDKDIFELLMKVISTQWSDDSKIKFKQVDLDTQSLANLFIDVEAKRLSRPSVAAGLKPANVPTGEMPGPLDRVDLRGAAAYLLRATQPLTLVIGEPGQGKSTLGQYVCQVHRAVYLEETAFLAAQPTRLTTREARLPIRVDLRDYVDWMEGGEPLSDHGGPAFDRARKPRKDVALDSFLAYLLHKRSGDRTVTVEMVQDVLDRFPMLVVLDGLDEVGQVRNRARIVTEIDDFASRLGRGAVMPQLIVTTRPNASGLPEPSHERFETISLVRLSPTLRTAYLRKWADVHNVRGRDRRALQTIFDHRSAEAHIAQLADNPMQLSILLYLIHARGDSLPSARTALYRSYMEIFLDRESKDPLVRRHRSDLEEITAYLGWHVQCLAESAGSDGRLPTKTIKRLINDYLYVQEKDNSIVDDLFTAVTDRVWALTSKVQGTFEFDVQPVREYFAATYLYKFAGGAAIPRDKVLQELITRPYWLNTCRFYAGCANENELSTLTDGLEEAFETNAHPGQIRTGAWALLVDGVFSERKRAQNRATKVLTDDLSVRLITHTIRNDLDMPTLALDRGGAQLAEHLQHTVQTDPSDNLAEERIALLAKLTAAAEHLKAWWRPHMEQAIGTRAEIAWLRVGAHFFGGNDLGPDTIVKLDLTAPGAAEAALSAAVNPPIGSAAEQQLIEAVLSGACSDATVTGYGYAADLLRVLRPQNFLQLARANEARKTSDIAGDHTLTAAQRQAAIQRLKKRDPRFDRIQAAMAFRKGQAGTTSPWGNTARALRDTIGPCWLAAEIAIIGAFVSNSRWRTGGDITGGSAALGPEPDYGRLLQETRYNRGTAQWWHDQYSAADDLLSRATWALALVAVAKDSVVGESIELLNNALTDLPATMVDALLRSSSRLGRSGQGRRLAASTLAAMAASSTEATLLVAHHTEAADGLPMLSGEQLAAVASLGTVGWPATSAISTRMMQHPTAAHLSLLTACGPYAAARVDDVALPNDIARSILNSPAQFPFAWVRAAERCVSNSAPERPLADVARTLRWFDEQ